MKISTGFPTEAQIYTQQIFCSLLTPIFDPIVLLDPLIKDSKFFSSKIGSYVENGMSRSQFNFYIPCRSFTIATTLCPNFLKFDEN